MKNKPVIKYYVFCNTHNKRVSDFYPEKGQANQKLKEYNDNNPDCFAVLKSSYT
jgi:hypothetical protein